MNRLYILGILFISLFASCKKESDGAFDFDVNGLKSLNVTIGESKVVPLEIVTTNGDPQKVVLSLSDMPEGIVYSFENVEGMPNYHSTLGMSVTKQARIGKHKASLKAISGDIVKTIDFEILVDGSLSMSMTVYDATDWTPEVNYGSLVDSAKIKLFTDEAAFLANQPADSAYTNREGKASFYKLQSGNYYYTVQKGDLSNIINPQLVNGVLKGFATTGIFRYSYEINGSAQPKAHVGDLRYRDITGDWLITEDDRVFADVLSIYKDVLSEKVVWIGK